MGNYEWYYFFSIDSYILYCSYTSLKKNEKYIYSKYVFYKLASKHLHHKLEKVYFLVINKNIQHSI